MNFIKKTLNVFKKGIIISNVLFFFLKLRVIFIGILKSTINMWNRWIATYLILLIYTWTTLTTSPTLVMGAGLFSTGVSQNYKISPKPCSVNGLEGTCMFVWECIRSDGQHVGMCMDSFMFGSCCSHNLTDNYVLPQQNGQQYHNILPTKPLVSNRTRPPTSNRPISSSTILRPHGGGTLVIRPPGAHITHQSGGYTSRPIPTTTTSTERYTPETTADLTPAASISAGL